MNKIFKYTIEPPTIRQTTRIRLPKNAKILSVQEQKNEVVLWAEVDPSEKEKEVQSLQLLITGEPIEDHGEREFISTVQLDGGGFILHVFKINN